MSHLSARITDLRERYQFATLRSARQRARERGQVLPIFVVMSVVLLGAAALLTDVAWWWVNEQRMQRAADAGALAGAVHLPGNQALAFQRAISETAKNGFVNNVDGVTVTPKRDPGDPRKLIVDIDGPVGTHFAGALCWEGGPCLRQIDVSVTGAATFVLPVPMGSPQNYYGVGFLKDAVTTTQTSTVSDDTDWQEATAALSGRWENAEQAQTNDNVYASETADGHRQIWTDFHLLGELPNDPSLIIEGLVVQLDDVRLTGSGSSGACEVEIEVSPDGGATWSDTLAAGSLPTSGYVDREVGSTTSTGVWGSHAWTRSDFADGQFQVRLTWRDGFSGCSSDRGVRVDQLEVRVDYQYDQVTTTTSIEEVPVRDPNGNVLAPHGFWGALQSQGAPNIQGDAYMTYYDTRTSRSNDDYTPESYYQYEIAFPPGSSGGEVWLFDPGFCHVDSNKGTGEYYTLGGSNGTSGYNPVSTFYDLYDTRNTPYDVTDDIRVYSSGADYRRLKLRDTVLDASSPVSASPCDDLVWHNDWVRIANGLSGDKKYRLHTHSTDPNSSSDQQSTTALNAFAIYAQANGGTPNVHGLGAMEAYVRLPGGRSSEFYLAQIDAEHAGKTMVIKLWDPGDTGNLAANLQILRPTGTSYQATSFNYSAERSSYNASSCQNRSGSNVSAVVTNTGGSSLYNGCWLTIEIPLPIDYDAPHPSTDSVTSEGGWWKIRYNMSGSSSDYSTDLTTWQVELRGNPVHLVLN